MATDISDMSCQCDSLRTMPGDSAGKGTPVRAEKPKRRTYSYSLSLPTLRPIWIAPILLDLASTMAIGIVPYPRCASCTVRPYRCSTPLPQSINESGRRLVVSSAAESVITLNTDPGSNGTEI